jgi:hypothetical protein
MKIGFCFLTYGSIKHESLWEEFFRPANPDSYQIYIHAKDRDLCKTQLKGARIIRFPKATNYADISLVRATLYLFEKASEGGCNYMILLSEDSIPLMSFRQVGRRMTGSQFVVQNRNLISDKSADHNRKNYKLVSPYIRRTMTFDRFQKQNMFFVISNGDLQVFLKKDYTCYFKHLYAPDEYFFINMFQHLGLKYRSGRVMLANEQNEIKTKSKQWNLTLPVLQRVMRMDYMFVRKVASVSSAGEQQLVRLYQKG